MAKGIQTEKKLEEFYKFEDILSYIGQWGATQRMEILLTSTVVFGSVLQNMAMVFLAGVPTHHCLVEPGTENMSLPKENGRESSRYSQCEIFDLNTTGSELGNISRTLSCGETVGRWYYDQSQFDNTIVSEWNLVCEDKWLRAFSKMMYFFGFFIGCLVIGYISDRFGRRPTLQGTTIIHLVFGIAVYFSPNYTAFTIFRCIIGVANGGQIGSAYVLSQEWCTKSMRVPRNVIAVFCVVLSQIALGGIAYLIRDWRQLALVIASPQLIYVWYYWLLYPSPRWLLINGREKEALQILQKAAIRNGRPLPEYFDISNVSVPKKVNTSVVDLVRTPNMRKTTLIVWYVWITVGLVHYGLSYNVGNLFGDIYLNFTIMGAVQIVRLPMAMVSQVINRRYAVVGYSVITGLSLLAAMITTDGSSIGRLVISCVGVVCNGSVFGLIYLYSIEVYPTPIRTTGFGIGSMWARVGTMLSPYVVLLSEVNGVLPFIVLGSTALIIAIVFMVAPETRTRPLSDTIEEAEKINKIFFRCRETVEREVEVIKLSQNEDLSQCATPLVAPKQE